MLHLPFARFVAAALAALLLAACGDGGDRRGPVVLAPSSMQEALIAVADRWTSKGKAEPVLSFAGTSALARQVIDGAPADLFVSADEAWMDRVARAGRIDRASRANLVSNRLVLVAPQDKAEPVALEREAILRALGRGRLAMADPNGVPAGRYGEAALASLGLWPALRNRITASENVRAALSLVARGEAPLGVVYTSDAAASDKVAVVAEFPPASHPPILYPLALIEGSANPEAAEFRDFLLSPEGRAILTAHGFAAP